MEKEQEKGVIEKTNLYLMNYREMERYISDAVSEVTQLPEEYNIQGKEIYLESIRDCRLETVIMHEHIKRSLESLKEDAVAAGEGYKYETLEAVFLQGKSFEEISRETGCGKNSPKKWCRDMIGKLSIKLFGAKAIK